MERERERERKLIYNVVDILIGIRPVLSQSVEYSKSYKLTIGSHQDSGTQGDIPRANLPNP